MVKFKVLVTRHLLGDGLEKLSKIAEVEVNTEERVLSREEFKERVRGKDGILSILGDKIDAEIIESGQKLKVISKNTLLLV